MEEKKLVFEDAPWNYPLCFNSDCKKCDLCMHYLLGQLAPEDCQSGSAVYPSAWKDGDCRCFREKKIVKFAWGFNNLYTGLTRGQASDIRSSLRAYLGSGMSAYYRYHHGERKLTPKQQQEILEIVKRFSSKEDATFDHYELAWDF